MILFNVSYEIVTPESAEDGEADERGMIVEGVRLREAIEAVGSTRTSLVGGGDGAEGNSSHAASLRWIMVYNGMEYETGATESRSLHIPESVTAASRARIARLLGARVAN